MRIEALKVRPRCCCDAPCLSVLTRRLGVSLITQILYAVVFCSRYLDLFWTKPSYLPWNFVLKLFYLGSSFYIILLMTRVYARTREWEKAWKFGSLCLGGSTVAAPLVLLIFKKWHRYDFDSVRIFIQISNTEG